MCQVNRNKLPVAAVCPINGVILACCFLTEKQIKVLLSNITWAKEHGSNIIQVVRGNFQVCLFVLTEERYSAVS